MRKVQLSLAIWNNETDRQEQLEWSGWLDVPGLAVCKSPVWDNEQRVWTRGETWRIVHVTSGMYIADFITGRDKALKLTEAIRDFAPWNEGKESIANRKIYESVREVRKEIGV